MPDTSPRVMAQVANVPEECIEAACDLSITYDKPKSRVVIHHNDREARVTAAEVARDFQSIGKAFRTLHADTLNDGKRR